MYQRADADTRKLPADSVVGDIFGHSVGIDGDTSIVGAPYDDDKGDFSGSAYLFNVIAGSQHAKLTASDGSTGDRFGWSVGISGGTAIIGAPSDDNNNGATGSAYLFDVATGSELAKLTPSDGAAQEFGGSVDISGNTAIVGAPLDRDNGEQSGSAYLFDIATGAELAKLTPNDGAALDLFGWSVGISGDTAIVGACYDDGEHSRSGSAYLFDIRSGTQLAKLTASDGATGDRFGWSVDISGDRAVVGAPHEGAGEYGVTDTGSAYLFDATTGMQLAKLIPNVRTVDQFGVSVGISSNSVIVGASSSSIDYPVGSVHVFSATTGMPLAETTPYGTGFGSSVGIWNATAIVGEPGSSSVYILDVTTIVPEPATLALASLAAAVAVRVRQRLKR
jgi:hypothetical protein